MYYRGESVTNYYYTKGNSQDRIVFFAILIIKKHLIETIRIIGKQVYLKQTTLLVSSYSLQKNRNSVIIAIIHSNFTEI